MKLAVFVDQVYWFDGQVYSTDEAYALFPARFADVCEEVVFIGRLAPGPGRKPYALDHPAHRMCPLPYYESIYDLWKAGPSLRRDIRQVIRANAAGWDAAWICGPNPIGLEIAAQCIGQGCPVFLVVRQNLVQQMRFANRGFRRAVAVAMAGWLEQRFRQLARERTVFAVGQEMAGAYRAAGGRVHLHFPSLVTQRQMEALSALPAAPEPDRLLWVGRLASEKGCHYLLAALALLRSRGVHCSLDVVGSGPELERLQAQATQLGLGEQVAFHGYVPYGPELFALYRQASALIVPSLSEGLPQVILEALAAGVPVVASAVGGIPALLRDHETGLLVPPADVPALAEAIAQIVSSPELREQLRCHGRALLCNNTLEAQRDRMLEIIRQEVLPAKRATFRTSFSDFPAGALPAQPTVSAVVPLYNEAAHIRSLVEALLAQDYPALTEIWLVDGRSEDGTMAALEELKARDARIKVLSNPRRNQAAGINLALAQAQGQVIIRLDGHAQYGPDVIRSSVRALLKTGAGGVGAIARPLSSGTAFGQGIAAAHESRFGVGAARFRQASSEGWVDTVWNGCYWKYIIDQVGPLREDLLRLEDNDLNARVRALGYGLYLSPDIKAYYYPRQTLAGLWRQYAANGYGVGRALLQDRHCLGLRHLAPLALVLGLAFSLAVSILWPPALLATAVITLSYLLAAALFSIMAYRTRPGRYALLLPAVFATLHLSYGLGTAQGLLASLVSRGIPRRMAE